MPLNPSADIVFADGPFAAPYQPQKPEIRRIFKQVEQAIDAFSSGAGSIAKASKSQLDADLAHPADVTAWVYNDAATANNGIYRKTGSSGAGSWTRILDLPFSFIVASNPGAGTPNAIQSTTSIPVSSSALVILPVSDTNTASPVTVSLNGGTALTIKTNSGNNVAVGGLVAGMMLLGIVSGSTFRLVSDQASAAIVAAAESSALAAQTAADEAQSLVGKAETALQPEDKGFANGNVVPVTSFEGLPALVIPGQLVVAQENVGAEDPITFNFIRKRTANGGPSSFVNTQLSAATYILAEGNVDSNEWAGIFGIQNHATGGVGQHVPLYSYMRRWGDSYSWSFCTEFQDYRQNPTQGGIGVEIGFFPVGPDSNNRRVALHLAFQRPLGFDGVTTNEIAYGIWCNPNPNTQVKYGMRFEGKFGVGLDFSGMDTSYSNRAIDLAQNTYISWLTSGTPKLNIGYNSTLGAMSMTGSKRRVGGTGSGGTVGSVVDQIILVLDGTQYAIDLKTYTP